MYELYILLNPKHSREAVKQRVGEITAALGQRGVMLTEVKTELSKPLAYPIATHTKAHAVLFRASVEPGINIDALARELIDSQDDVLRRLVFRKDHKDTKQETSIIEQLRSRRPVTQERPARPKPTYTQGTTATQKSKEAAPDTAEIDKKLEELLQ